MKIYYPMEKLADNNIDLPLSEDNLLKLITSKLAAYSKEEIERGELGFGGCEVVEVEIEMKTVAVYEIKQRVEFNATKRQIL